MVLGSRQSAVGSRTSVTCRDVIHRPIAVAALVCVAALLLVPLASAQSADASRPATPSDALSPSVRPTRFEVAVLGGWIGGADLGTTDASLITNQVPTGGLTALFTTSTAIGAAPVVEGRLGFRLGGGWYLESGLGYAQPALRVRISGDVEGAPDVTATTSTSQYIVDGGLQYRWTRRRVSPFVMGGGGYLRQLDAPRTTASTGAVYYGGGGAVVRIAPGRRGFWGHVALRGDARVVWLRDGIILDDQRDPTLSVTGGITAGW